MSVYSSFGIFSLFSFTCYAIWNSSSNKGDKNYLDQKQVYFIKLLNSLPTEIPVVTTCTNELCKCSMQMKCLIELNSRGNFQRF